MAEAAQPGGDSRKIARLALAIALVGVLVVVIIRVTGNREAAAPAAPAAAGQEQPDVATMIAALEQRLAAHPGDLEGWRMLGWADFQTQRYAAAVRAYERAAALAPDQAESWSALGEARVRATGSVGADAHAAFAKALAIDPKDPRARYFLAVEKDVAGDHRTAVDDWIALLKDAPPGAPWADSVHALVTQVAGREKIDIAGRLPPLPAAATDGAAVAGAAIPGPSAADMAAARQMPPSQQDAMVRGMVDRLAARLAADPKDAAGWIRLMRARMVLGETAAAAQALASARRAFAGDKAVLSQLDQAAQTLSVPRG
jgi:cytochrome c-type biogenesis protein CcmH